MHMSWETQIWWFSFCPHFHIIVCLLPLLQFHSHGNIVWKSPYRTVHFDDVLAEDWWHNSNKLCRLTTDHIISKLRVVRPSLRPLFFSWQVAIMEKVTKNPRPSPNRQSVSSIVERRVIKSTLCVASLTGSLVSKDLAYSRVIPCKYKRDDWDRQGDKWG